MISGRDALASIEQTISRARSSETQLETTLHAAEETAARLRAERTAALKHLAQIRLDSFMREGVVGPLDAAERRALDLVKDRTRELQAEGATRQRLYADVQAAEAERHQRAASLEQALTALEGVKQAAQPKIRASAAWKAQEAKIAEAIKIADESDKKARVAEEDREIKRKPYEADPLFMYLWNAKFGQAEYTGGNIARFFDRMIASKVKFADARANYAMLNEIPLRLREHADRRKAAVETERQGLAKAEAQALAEVGAGNLVGAVEAARQALITAEKALSMKRVTLEEFETKSAAALKDPAYEQAVQLLAEADSRDDIRQLFADASRTPTKDDDRIVRQIETIDRKLGAAEQESEQIRAEARDMARRRAEVERERDHFRRRGYDNPYGGFQNDNILGQILGGILQGSIQGSILRDALRDGYRQRDNSWGGGNAGGSVFGPWTVPDNSSSSGGGQWVPPWLDGGGGGSWGGDGGGGGFGGGGGGGDGFSTGGGV
jgi:succinate dehydrogenase flavin-adding protein (antitoxin of CptAB toxin-antitoxin module)